MLEESKKRKGGWTERVCFLLESLSDKSRGIFNHRRGVTTVLNDLFLNRLSTSRFHATIPAPTERYWRQSRADNYDSAASDGIICQRR